MGKSTVTWEWVTNRAAADRTDWAGRLWYSFYERGADMRDFKSTALAYITHQPLEAFRTRPEAELTSALLSELTRAPFLLVLDGLERVLSAYHRADAAQLRDEDVREDADTGLTGRRPQDCIRPDDHDLLLHLATAAPSKLLVSSRLMPRALLNTGGEPVPGVRRVLLHGLASEDAEAMLRRAGIRGDGERMRRYLAQALDCHPLVVGFVAGLVRKAPWARMDFDRWADDPRGGAAVNLADPDLRQRQTNILKLAFDALEPLACELLARLGMLANAVGYDVVEALNPARPDPPEEVPQPTAPDDDRDFIMFYLQRELGSAKGKRVRADLERQIAERPQQVQRRYDAACTDYAEYQAAADSWRRSPEVRQAPYWLDDTLADLEARGLLQWDRPSGTFDLHPVVRGYAIGALDPQARGEAGQRVADIFSTRAEPDYEKIGSPQALGDRIQIAQALCLAGKLQQAWEVLALRPIHALQRLDAPHTTLSLLRPMFPNGWMSPPHGLNDSVSVATEAAIALLSIGRLREAELQAVYSIQHANLRRQGYQLSSSLRIHYSVLEDRHSYARASRALALAQEVAVVVDDGPGLLLCDVFLVNGRIARGQCKDARRLWTDLTSGPAWAHRESHLEGEGQIAEGWLLYREGSLTATFVEGAMEHFQALSRRLHARKLWQLAGAWHQSEDRDAEAAYAFAQAIRMAREAGKTDAASEAGRGLSLARLGRRREAEAAAASAERDPPHVSLAELYLALEQRNQARTHALAGYEEAWADGPPWCHHWDLQRCRAVLAALSEPEPRLPPFDPAKVKPLDYEPDIRSLLAEHAKKR